MVAVISVVPLFVAVNDAMSPVPLAARFISVLSLVQLYIVPLPDVPAKVTDVAAPLHCTRLVGVVTVGVG